MTTTTALGPTGTDRTTARPQTWLHRPVLAKVPEVTLFFWVVKLLTTGMGEAASDALAGVNLVLAAGVGLIGFVAAMWLQLRSDRYRPWTYWFAVAMVAVFGTMVADGVHQVLGLGYQVTTGLYALGLVVVLALWHRFEHSLDIHSITTRRRECFYWLTVLATFALGTAAGDLTAIGMGLGYFESIGVYAALMLLVVVAWRMGLGSVAAFWTAYVFTRPLGASIADWLGKPSGNGGGVGFGDGPVALAAAAVIIVLVAVMARTHHGVRDATD